MPFFRERLFIAAGGVAILAMMALLDYLQHPKNPTRLKEYAFLVGTTFAAVVYGVAHDQVTATISPGYFLRWKGLADDPQPFRWAVTILAIRASFAAGVVAGSALLIANNRFPRRKLPILSYRELARLALVPPITAALFAGTWGVANAGLQIGAATARDYVAPEDVRAFVVVWAVHAGSYAGALVGVVLASVTVVRRRRRAEATSEAPARSA